MKPDTQRKTPNGTRSFSTYAIRKADIAAVQPQVLEMEPKGHIFPLPDLPLPSHANLKHRYDPIVKQVTGLIMRHGKLGVAQRVRPSVPPS